MGGSNSVETCESTTWSSGVSITNLSVRFRAGVRSGGRFGGGAETVHGPWTHAVTGRWSLRPDLKWGQSKAAGDDPINAGGTAVLSICDPGVNVRVGGCKSKAQ